MTNADLRGADLRETNLTYFVGADLAGANLSYATMSCARFEASNLAGAKLVYLSARKTSFRGANLDSADLDYAYFDRADFSLARLRNASLEGVTFARSHLIDSDLTSAKLSYTVFLHADLSRAVGLEQCIHDASSAIDWATLERSGPISRHFLEGTGWPGDVLDYLLPLTSKPLRFQSCFISHSATDHEFVSKLEADLNDRGIASWCAPNSLYPGDHLRTSIDQAISLYDRVIVVLSQNSLDSQWVEAEVESALARERSGATRVLIPLRIDDDVIAATCGWPALIKNTRHIADFTKWREERVYALQLEQLCSALRHSPGLPPRVARRLTSR